MKEKGFTLIELLAVIVILAIIALIATPIVLNIIKDSKESATLQSAEFYLGAVETAVAKKIMDDPTFKPTSCEIQKDGNLKCDEIDVKIEINGEKPTSGTIILKSGEIEDVTLMYGEKTITKNNEGKLVYVEAENYIIDTDLEFAYDNQQNAYFAYLTITKDIADKFQVGMDYDYIIDDDKVITLTAINTPALGGFALYFADINDSSNSNIVLISDEKLTFVSYKELSGQHNLKLGNSRPIQDNLFFIIEPDGDIAITSYNFISDSADILIKDEDGTEYFNDTVELMMNDKSEGDGMIGISTGCRNNITELPSVYSAISEGKIITIEVRQIVNGREIVSTISKNIDEMIYFEGAYASSSHIMSLIGLGGC